MADTVRTCALQMAHSARPRMYATLIFSSVLESMLHIFCFALQVAAAAASDGFALSLRQRVSYLSSFSVLLFHLSLI